MSLDSQTISLVVYIDNIFTIWSDGIEAFDLNEAHSTIKFTAEWSISFLDTCVTLEGGIISTSLHRKSTDTYQYLAAKSCHPRHCKAAVPYSQALRIQRICSSDHDFRKTLITTLVGCGCNLSFIRQQIDRSSMINRDALAPNAQSTSSYSLQVHLVITFHPNLPIFSCPH